MSISDELNTLNLLIANGTEEEVLDHIRTNNIPPELAGDLPEEMSPISWAADRGLGNVLNTLLSLGFTPHPDRHPIHYASEKGRLGVVTSLVEDHNTDVMCVDKSNETPLFLASRRGRFEVVKYLVERGADVNFGGRIPPLVIAIARNEFHITDYLIRNGANVNKEDTYGRSPLHAVARKGCVDIARTLMEEGASVNVKCTDQESPFMTGSLFGHLSMMKFLESHGADVNAIDKYGNTALHLAVMKGHYGIVRYLLVDLCVMCTINSYCESPFSIALDNMDYDILLLFHKAGRWPSNVLCDFPDDSTKLLMPIIDIVTKPYLLQELACFQLRSMLGPRLASKVNHLPVPGAVKKFILLTHIPSCRPFRDVDLTKKIWAVYSSHVIK